MKPLIISYFRPCASKTMNLSFGGTFAPQPVWQSMLAPAPHRAVKRKEPELNSRKPAAADDDARPLKFYRFNPQTEANNAGPSFVAKARPVEIEQMDTASDNLPDLKAAQDSPATCMFERCNSTQ